MGENKTEFFSVSSICRDEEASLHDFFDGLKEYLAYDEADIVICDTGSTDRSIEIIKEYELRYPGKVKLVEAGEKFKYIATQEEADEWEKQYGFKPSFEVGKGYFHFADARNYAATFSKHDFNLSCDIDEKPEWDLPEFLKVLPEADHLTYQFVFAHNPDGTPGLQFQHSKIYRTSKIHWVNQVHEIEANRPGIEAKPPTYTTTLTHHHYQKKKESRGNYLPGLELSVLHGENPDRNTYYLAREYFYVKRYEDSIKMFDKALGIQWWKPERGQAYIFQGLCYKLLGKPDEAIKCFHKSLAECDTRREPFWELGLIHDELGHKEEAITYWTAAMAVPFKPHGYLNSMELYGAMIPDRLAMLYSQKGDKETSKKWWLIALQNNPDQRILGNFKYYYGEDVPKVSIVVPTCRPDGFRRLKASIEADTSYPNYEIIEKEKEGTAVEKFNEGVQESNGEFIVFIADDCEVRQGWLVQAYSAFREKFGLGKGLVIFNDDHWNGTLCGHFMCSKNIQEELEG
jgi:tetratricopeptide (TPR) repeat protein